MKYNSDMSDSKEKHVSETTRDTFCKEEFKSSFQEANAYYDRNLRDYALSEPVRRIIDGCFDIQRDEQFVDFLRNVFILHGKNGPKNTYIKKLNDKHLLFLYTHQEQLVSVMFEKFYALWIDLGINEKYRKKHKFKTLCEFYARIILVIELDFYMRAAHKYVIDPEEKKTVDEAEEIREYLDRGILKYIFKLHVDIESGHTKVYRYRYQEGGNYIKEPNEYTDFNTNIVLGYVGVNDIDDENADFTKYIINNPENKTKLFNRIDSALKYQVDLMFSEDKEQYFKITEKVYVDGRFMCPLPISRTYLDIIVNYIHEFLGIKVKKNGLDHIFVSTEDSDSTYTLNKSNKSYYHYLNCMYKDLESLYKPAPNTKKYSNPTSYLFKDWNCDAGCLSMIVEPEKMEIFYNSMMKECRAQYKDKEVIECYDLNLESSDKQAILEYGTVFKAKPSINMKLLVNSKVNLVADGLFSEKSNVKLLNIIKIENAYDTKSIIALLNRLNFGKLAFNTPNAYGYIKTIKSVIESPKLLHSHIIRSDDGLCIHTIPKLQYYAAIRFINLSNSDDDDLNLEDLSSIENVLVDSKQNSLERVQKWKDDYEKKDLNFDSMCNRLDERFVNVKELDSRSGKKEENSVYSVYLHMDDVGKALIDLLKHIKPDISEKDIELIKEGYKIDVLSTDTSSFYTYGRKEKYKIDQYVPTTDVVTGTIIKVEEDKFVWGDKRIHGDIQAEIYSKIINKSDVLIEDPMKFLIDVLTNSNVKFALDKDINVTTKHQQNDGEDVEEDEEDGEKITNDYEIPSCNWFRKLLQLTRLKCANQDIEKYIRISAKNIMIRVNTVFNKK